jgi:hypothetical protein
MEEDTVGEDSFVELRHITAYRVFMRSNEWLSQWLESEIQGNAMGCEVCG